MLHTFGGFDGLGVVEALLLGGDDGLEGLARLEEQDKTSVFGAVWFLGARVIFDCRHVTLML